MQRPPTVRRRPADSSRSNSSNSDGTQRKAAAAAGSSRHTQQAGIDSAVRWQHAQQRVLRRLGWAAASVALVLLALLAATHASLWPQLGPAILQQLGSRDGHGYDDSGYDDGGSRSSSWSRADSNSPQHGREPALPQHAGSVGSDGTVYGPSLGTFPRGCKWREVTNATSKDASSSSKDSSSSSANTSVPAVSATVLSAPATYEYWDAAARAWTRDQPAACRLSGFAAPGPPKPWRLHKGSPRTEVQPHAHHVMYRNLWYNSGRWYALVDSGRSVAAWKWSRNHGVTPLHVADAGAWLNTTRWRLVPGDTLLFDFIFFVHLTAIGHWWELLGPLFSVLKQQAAAGSSKDGRNGSSGGGSSFRRPCDRVVLLHLQRSHLMEWVRAVMAVALGVGPHSELPPILLQQETQHVWQQLTMPLEGVSPDEWVMFDRVMMLRDLFTGGKRSFASTQDARQFRAAVYRQYDLPPPSPRRAKAVPRVITFQRKRANRRILNEAELLQLLARYGEVRVVEFNASTSFAQQLAAMRDTGVFVAPHTSNLANAVFLQPGSAVVELIQRHWTWNAIDQSFRDHTQQLGDIHHYAWRANAPNASVYQRERDAARFTNWTTAECLSEDCTEAATRVDIRVDLPALQRLLDSRLPLVLRGARVADAALPWPKAV